MTEQGFETIIRETKRVVLSAIMAHLPARFHHAIDDVAQETYMRAFRGLKKFRGESAITSWLYVIARNESLRMSGRLSREEEKIIKSGRQMEITPAPDSESLDRLRDDVARLPEKYKTVMELLLYGMNETQITKELSMKRGTVKSRISRGRLLLYRMASGGETYE